MRGFSLGLVWRVHSLFIDGATAAAGTGTVVSSYPSPADEWVEFDS